MALNYADLNLLRKGLDYTRRNRNWVVALGALGVTGYGAYRAYCSPSMVRKRKRFLKLIGAFVSLAEMVSDSADVIGIVSKDLKEFISSDSDQIPRSLKQISKIAKSDEFSQSIVKVTSALTIGVVRGYQQETAVNVSGAANSGLFDQVLDKLFTDAGSGFASVIVGSFAKNLVLALFSERKANATGSDIEYSVPGWVDVLCQDKCRELIGDCIQLFVSTAVAVYLDRTMNINTYNEIFSGLTNPKHETKMRDMLVAICSGAVGTLVKTSHQVLTSSDMDMDTTSKIYSSLPLSFKAKKLLDEDENMYTGWTNEASSTLAEARNKRFILDLTGRVTFLSVRSFLEFLLEKLYECVRKSIHIVQEEVKTLRRSVDVIQEEVVDRSAEARRYVSGKSSTAVSVCLALCLHILNGPWILVPN